MRLPAERRAARRGRKQMDGDNEMSIAPTPYRILALVYSDGLAADQIDFESWATRSATRDSLWRGSFSTRNSSATGPDAIWRLRNSRQELSWKFPKTAERKREDVEWIGEHCRRPSSLLSSLSKANRPIDPQQIRQTRGRGPGLRDTLSDAVQLAYRSSSVSPIAILNNGASLPEAGRRSAFYGSHRVNEWLLEQGSTRSWRPDDPPRG